MATDDSIGADNAPPPRLLRWLERLPKVAIFIGVLVITVGFLWTPGLTGAILTTALAAGAAFLLYATWPAHTATSTRLVRVLVVAVLAVLGIAKFFV
ncbi:DUF6703 family protein [Stackebrandtia nassauensis]|uniref:Uncharacterized protein n=1 Tax=Stackebrandtia nassauensis (strain DSM 44728 / CIP 108903 / NRRL B-16338 / NBRC 102104 / LLR-40K-21) TaxID=446470 RepID=D3Q0L3_STANL|nr:DUF6703 family protein [Stackebrandtia nassauensis]ADD41749.1 hypothetical protein Snas_2055 [Stackebrandtia nassauensis DSM 44728]